MNPISDSNANLHSETRGHHRPRSVDVPWFAAPMVLTVFTAIACCSRSNPIPTPPDATVVAPSDDDAVVVPNISLQLGDQSPPPADEAVAGSANEPVDQRVTVEELKNDPRIGPLVALFPDLLVEYATGGAVLSLQNQSVDYPPAASSALRRTLKDEILPALESARIASKTVSQQFGTPSFIPRTTSIHTPGDVSESLQAVIRHEWDIASDEGADISPSLWKRLNSLPTESTSRARHPFPVIDANGNIRQTDDWRDPNRLLSQVRESSQTATLIYGELFAVCHLLKAASEHIAVTRALITQVTDLVNDTSPELRMSTVMSLGMNFRAVEGEWDRRFRESFRKIHVAREGSVNDLSDLMDDRDEGLAHLFRTWDTEAASAQKALHAAWASMQSLMKEGSATQGLTLATLTAPLPIVNPLKVDGLARTGMIRHPTHHGAYLLDGKNEYSTSVLAPGFQGGDNSALLDATVLPVATRHLFPADSTTFPQRYEGMLIADGYGSLQMTLTIEAVYRGAVTRHATTGDVFLNGRDAWGNAPDYPTTLLCIDIATGTLRVVNHSHGAIPLYDGASRAAIEVFAEGADVVIPVVCFLEGASFEVHRSSPTLLNSLKSASAFIGVLPAEDYGSRLPLRDVVYLRQENAWLCGGTVTPEGRWRNVFGESRFTELSGHNRVHRLDLRPSQRAP
jgi:hypothetical protein